MTLPLIESHPEQLGGLDPTAIANCVDECLACSRTCTGCADACLSERDPASLVHCIRTDLDCADLCATTARVLSRRTGTNGVLDALLRACEQACRTCADECGRHAAHHRHCALCEEACRSCADACQQLSAHLVGTGK
ncbi:four-helix bundle copper-binding protein [Amycolatopsis orientalis]|uniref:four-helix bundle copper-binding protein n=1 Tax=Amycolatopsis orientalis TaxID=31958 RepID=UPI0003A5E5CF|nr:four-helix bundle copper-binding protein [Amycolatopsis orientalis]